jgi:hypothetical protein
MRSRNCFLDLPEFRPHTVPTGFPLKLEGTATGVPTNEDETQEGEGLWLAEPPPLTIGHHMSSAAWHTMRPTAGSDKKRGSRKSKQDLATRENTAVAAALESSLIGDKTTLC